MTDTFLWLKEKTPFFLPFGLSEGTKILGVDCLSLMWSNKERERRGT